MTARGKTVSLKLGKRTRDPPKTLTYRGKRYTRYSKGFGNMGAVRTSAYVAEQYYRKVIIVSYEIKWKSTRGKVTTYAVYKRERAPPLYKTIDNRRYKRLGIFTNKREAERAARYHREELGEKARVVPTSGDYTVYIRGR